MTRKEWIEHVRELHYEMGHRPPRYPVPAILCSVHIYHDMVIAVQSPPCTSGYFTKRLATGDKARF